jgi:hypothetical protein
MSRGVCHTRVTTAARAREIPEQQAVSGTRYLCRVHDGSASLAFLPAVLVSSRVTRARHAIRASHHETIENTRCRTR